MKKNNLIFCILFFTLVSACNNSDFSPVGEYEDKLIVNCVLDSRFSLQIVNVQGTYLLNDSEHYKTIKNIKVKLSDGQNNYYFKDTVFGSIKNYYSFYLKDFIPKRGIEYILAVEADAYNSVTSKVKIPAESQIGTELRVYSNDILTQITQNNAKGYLIRMFVDYEITENNITKKFKTEVPAFIRKNNETGEVESIDYPVLSRTRYSAFPYDNLIYSLTSIRTNLNQKIKIIKGYVIISSIDENLYNYYMSVQGFNDPYSIRLDQPFFSNIQQGFGLFGTIVSDSDKFHVSPDLIKALEYIDGQE